MATDRYGTFEVLAAPWKEDGPTRHGVIDKDSGIEWETAGPGSAAALAGELNKRGADRRAERKADFVAGYVAHEFRVHLTIDEHFERHIKGEA